MAKASSERTYGQRYTKGVELYDLIKNEIGFDPQNNPLITKVAFLAFLATVKAANKQVDDLTPIYDGVQDARVEMYHGAQGLVKRGGMVRDLLGAYLNGKNSTAFLTVQALTQEMRNYRKPKPKDKDVANGTDPAVDAEPSQAQLSFGSLLAKGREVVAVMKTPATTYKTANPLVTVAAFEAFLDAMEAQNTTISDALTPLNTAIRKRNQLVEGEEGLGVRVAAIKSHVAGEMGKGTDLHKALLKVRYA